MIINKVRPVTSFSNNLNSNDLNLKRLDPAAGKPIIVTAIIAIALIFSFSIALNENTLNKSNYVYAQGQHQQQDSDKASSSSSENKVTIHLNSVKFAPLTNSDHNQLKILADYQTNDPSLVNTPMTGTMKVYQTDGTLLKSSSIQKGYVLGQSGTISFATSFTDKTIQNVKADVYLTDTLGAAKISNILSTEASLDK